MILGTRVGVLHLAEQREPRLATCEQVGGWMGMATIPSCIVNLTGMKVIREEEWMHYATKYHPSLH